MNAEAAKFNRTEHRLTMQGREALEVRGVTDVISFDEQTVVLDTVCGKLAVDGAALHIHVLNMEQGIVSMDGQVDAISYYESEREEKGSKSGLFGKLFR